MSPQIRLSLFVGDKGAHIWSQLFEPTLSETFGDGVGHIPTEGQREVPIPVQREQLIPECSYELLEGEGVGEDLLIDQQAGEGTTSAVLLMAI